MLSLVLIVGWTTRKYVPAVAKPVYLIDTYTYKPPDRMKVSRENYIRGARMRKIWGEEALQFQEKLLNSSGLGDETYFPDSEPPVHFLAPPRPRFLKCGCAHLAAAAFPCFWHYQAQWVTPMSAVLSLQTPYPSVAEVPQVCARCERDRALMSEGPCALWQASSRSR